MIVDFHLDRQIQYTKGRLLSQAKQQKEIKSELYFQCQLQLRQKSFDGVLRFLELKGEKNQMGVPYSPLVLRMD